jgi:hypothetical protein
LQIKPNAKQLAEANRVERQSQKLNYRMFKTVVVRPKQGVVKVKIYERFNYKI